MFKLCTKLVICVYVESFLTVHGVVTDCGLEKSSSRSHIADLPLSQMSLWAASSYWFASSEWLENLRPISNFEANQVQFSSREANFILQLRPRFNLSLYFATRLAEHFSDQHRWKTDASKSQNSDQKWASELASKQAIPAQRCFGLAPDPRVIQFSHRSSSFLSTVTIKHHLRYHGDDGHYHGHGHHHRRQHHEGKTVGLSIIIIFIGVCYYVIKKWKYAMKNLTRL